MRRMEVIARASMDSNAPTLFWRETGQREVEEINEAVQQVPRRIDFHSQASFGEVHLHLIGALFQAAPYLGFMLAQQIVDELLARIIRNSLGGVHQAQGRRRDHGLLNRDMRVAHGDIQITVSVSAIPERTIREPRQPAGVTVRERDGETIGGRVQKPVHAVGRETAILPLFAVGHHWRASSFKPLEGVSNGILKERGEIRILVGIPTAGLSDPFDQGEWSWNASNWLGGNAD